MNTQSAPLTILTAADAAPTPPTEAAVLPDWWYRSDSTVETVELNLWSSQATTLTNAALVAAVTHEHEFTGTAFDSVDHTVDQLTMTDHGLRTGDGPLRLTTTGTMPNGLDAETNYWIIRTGASTLKLATSLANALTGTAVEIFANGTGILSIQASTSDRLWWHVCSSLPASISLDDGLGYTTRVPNPLGALAFGVIGTLSEGGDLSAEVTPVIAAG